MEAPQPLVGRYRFLRTFQGAPSGAIWLASDTVRGQTVVAATVSGPRVQGLKRMVGVQHANLAPLIEFFDRVSASEVPSAAPIRPGTGVGVAEYVAGQTLHERLETGSVSRVKAVSWTLRIAAALVAIHTRGGVHGALSPRAIIVARNDGGTVPVLTNLRAIANGAYCSPERVRGGGPSPQDDAWALHATLYTAVTGAPPFGGKTREQVAQAILTGAVYTLADYGIDDPALQGILSRGLHPHPGSRPRTVVDLGRELTAWLATQAEPEQDGSTMAPPPDFSTRSIPPPQIDDEAVTSAAVYTHQLGSLPATLKDTPITIPQIRNAPEPGDQAVLAALTTKLHPPEIASLMDAMARGSSPDAAHGSTASEDDEDEDATAVMSMPELEGLRQQVFRAENVRPSARSTPDPASIDGSPSQDVEAVPIARAPAQPQAAAREDASRSPSPEHWPARSLFDSATEEMFLQPPQQQVEVIVPKAPEAPLPVDESQAPPAATAVPTQPAQAGVSAAVPTQRSSGRAMLWLSLVVLFVVTFGASAALAIKFRDKLPVIPGINPRPARSPVEPSSPSRPSASARPSASPSAPASAAASAAASAEPSASSSGIVEPPASASAAASGTTPAPGTAPTACIKGFFASDTFVRDVPLDYVCEEPDPRTATLSLHRMLVRAGAGSVSGGMKVWSGLGWYELPIVVILRQSCCPEGKTWTWPEAEGTCPALGPLVEKVVASRNDSADLKAAEQAYEEGIRCYFTTGLPRPFRYNALPNAANRGAFEGFVRATAR